MNTQTYQIKVTLRRGPGWIVTVTAENVIDAVITGLCKLGLTTLSLVTGITIGEM